MKIWAQWLERGVLALVVLAVFVVCTDWLQWRMRLARGAGYGEVTVTRMVVAPLKGGREEYYPDGTNAERCSRSLIAWGEATRACWKAEQEPVVFAR